MAKEKCKSRGYNVPHTTRPHHLHHAHKDVSCDRSQKIPHERFDSKQPSPKIPNKKAHCIGFRPHAALSCVGGLASKQDPKNRTQGAVHDRIHRTHRIHQIHQIQSTESNEPTESTDAPYNENAWRLFSRERNGLETHVLKINATSCLVRSGDALAKVDVSARFFFPEPQDETATATTAAKAHKKR